MKRLSVLILASALLAAGCSTPQTNAPDTPTRTMDGVLVGPNGMTLYTFERDGVNTGKSACVGGCLTNWPALIAPDTAKPIGGYSVITRDDGRKQWAYQGRPLYYWARDAKPGDKTGDGLLGGAWKVARP